MFWATEWGFCTESDNFTIFLIWSVGYAAVYCENDSTFNLNLPCCVAISRTTLPVRNRTSHNQCFCVSVILSHINHLMCLKPCWHCTIKPVSPMSGTGSTHPHYIQFHLTRYHLTQFHPIPYFADRNLATCSHPNDFQWVQTDWSVFDVMRQAQHQPSILWNYHFTMLETCTNIWYDSIAERMWFSQTSV